MASVFEISFTPLRRQNQNWNGGSFLSSSVSGSESALPFGTASWNPIRSNTKLPGAALKILFTAVTKPDSERQFSPSV